MRALCIWVAQLDVTHYYTSCPNDMWPTDSSPITVGQCNGRLGQGGLGYVRRAKQYKIGGLIGLANRCQD